MELFGLPENSGQSFQLLWTINLFTKLNQNQCALSLIPALYKVKLLKYKYTVSSSITNLHTIFEENWLFRMSQKSIAKFDLCKKFFANNIIHYSIRKI